MTTMTPWALSPFEILLHAEMHYRNGEDFDRRIAVVGFDNSIELSIHTYLSLHPIQRQNRTYPKADCERWLENFYSKIEFLEVEVGRRNLAMVCDRAQFIWYHDVRNGQYHVGGATVPQARELEGIRKAAIWVFGTLFDVPDVEALLDQFITVRPGNDLPKRNEGDDRLIDREFGMVELAGKPYYLSEVIHAFDAVQYSELANDIRKRDASNEEMKEVKE
jgi:hypothetical protein